MPKHAEKRVVPYRAEQMFDLVADIDRYPEFLPWCRAARVRWRKDEVLHADLVIGFRMFRGRFTSKVTLDRPNEITVAYAKGPAHHRGPFHHLRNHWKFTDRPEGGCLIDFYVDFEFRSRLFHGLIEMLFAEAVHRMVRAFEKRARQIYGPAGLAPGRIGAPAKG